MARSGNWFKVMMFVLTHSGISHELRFTLVRAIFTVQIVINLVRVTQVLTSITARGVCLNFNCIAASRIHWRKKEANCIFNLGKRWSIFLLHSLSFSEFCLAKRLIFLFSLKARDKTGTYSHRNVFLYRCFMPCLKATFDFFIRNIM